MTRLDCAAERSVPSLAVLRDRFREVNGIAETHRWVEWFKLGPLPVPVPNPPARRRALQIHDLHHLVTGYQTDLAGEFQISAWECGAGLHNEPLAWIFCTSGTLGGMLRFPHRTVRAYAYGRQCRSLFSQNLAHLDATTLQAAQAWCRTDKITEVQPKLRDGLRAVGWAVLGLAVLVIPPLAWLLARTAPTPSRLADPPTSRHPVGARVGCGDLDRSPGRSGRPGRAQRPSRC